MQAWILWYLFWLGVAVGLTILVMTAYRVISPRWLRWALMGSGALVIGRYVTMAVLATGAQEVAALPQRLWFGSAVGLTFPGVVAVDQLVRHPAMTPKKLLRAYAPFLACYALAIGLGSAPALALTQIIFAGLMVWLGVQLVKKLPSQHIKVALVILMAAYLYLALDGVLLALGVWYRWPFLYSEILTLLALWWAFETARQHPL